jgi:uncharacterized protein (UPF0261 family)
MKQIVVIATLDTKGPEIAYVRDRIQALGAKPIIVDSGILGEANGIVADVSRDEVARAAGHSIDEIRAAGSRGAAVELMSHGVREVVLRLWREKRLDCILCFGGAEGALLGVAGIHALPLGVPKVLVTPSASGRRRFAPFAGDSDIFIMHSVIDILGINPISRSVFDNAVAAVIGMAHIGSGAVRIAARQLVGITMLGNTTPGAMRLREVLEEAGQQTVVFHANGVGGSAMEKLAAAGSLSGVVDYTLAEISNSYMDGVLSAGPDRLRVAGRCGLPQVIVPGGIDFFNQPAPLPEKWIGRKVYDHNPISILVRLLPDEMAAIGHIVAQRLNEATGPVRVVIPNRGFSINAVPGGKLWDPEGDDAFIESLAAALRPDIPLELIDTHVNDPAFAELVAARYLSMVSGATGRLAARST